MRLADGRVIRWVQGLPRRWMAAVDEPEGALAGADAYAP